MLFDQSLSAFYQMLLNDEGGDLLGDSVFVRDSLGKLRLVVRRNNLDENRIGALRRRIRKELGVYSVDPPGNIVRDIDDAAFEKIDLALQESVLDGRGAYGSVRLLDNRISGSDWLLQPSGSPEPGTVAQKLVFWSFKGGVGRSTALTVLAVNLARRGHNVLVFDLDLEAPGVGELLLARGEKPDLGILDYLIEDGLQEGAGNALLGRIVGTSSLVEGGGLIKVCAATGAASEHNPQNYLSKLFRVYRPVIRASGVEEPFSNRIRTLVDSLSAASNYSAILVDARAGLNESTAAAVLGLGADVLLFGHNTPQTFSGYRYALAHLNRFVVPEQGEWRLKLKMIHAKASSSKKSQEQFRDSAYEIFSDFLYDQNGDFSFSLTDRDAPHSPWTILDESSFRDFDPLAEPDLIESPYARAAFGEFLESACERLNV